MRLLCALVPSLLALQICPGLFGQEVVSARSGMVHFTQGQVLLDDHALDRKSGSFPAIKEGSTLRTEKGRAEILLTPGTFLRLDENTSIRMVSTELADTRLVFVGGAAILDITDSARARNGIGITYKDARMQFPNKGVYRLDADTGVLQVYSGEAQVTYDGKETRVDPSHLFFCWLGLETNKLGNGTEDEFFDWASDRNQAIVDENQLAEQTAHDPGDADMDPSGQLGGGLGPYLGGPGLGSPGLGSPGLGSPNFGSPGLNNTYPPQYGSAPYSTYSMGSTLFNPFLNVGPTPYIPYGYPFLVVTRPYWTAHSQWPHTGINPGTNPGTNPGNNPGNRRLWHPVTSGSSPILPLPTHITGVGPVGFRSTMPRVGVGAATVVRPSAPMVIRPPAVHAVGGRR